jgi:hypothetical protein
MAPPKRIAVANPSAGRRLDESYIRTVYNELKAPENRSVLTALGMFAVSFVLSWKSSW